VTAAALALLVTGSAAASSYTLRLGDTLSGVANHFGVSVSALASANHLAHPDTVLAGTRLVIPTADGALTQGGALPSRLLAHPDRLALRPLFRRWSAAAGVPASLVEGLAWMESGWQQSVVSRTGAVGIGQLEPSTVTFVSGLIGRRLNGRVASDNIRMSARYLRYLLEETHGNVADALAGYYQGLVSVRARGMMSWTRVYVADVIGFERSFSPG
jgi:LysM repeat protein